MKEDNNIDQKQIYYTWKRHTFTIKSPLPSKWVYASRAPHHEATVRSCTVCPRLYFKQGILHIMPSSRVYTSDPAQYCAIDGILSVRFSITMPLHYSMWEILHTSHFMLEILHLVQGNAVHSHIGTKPLSGTPQIGIYSLIQSSSITAFSLTFPNEPQPQMAHALYLTVDF